MKGKDKLPSKLHFGRRPSLCKSLINSDVMLRFYTMDGEPALYDLSYIVGIIPANIARWKSVSGGGKDIEIGEQIVVIVTNNGPIPTCHTVDELQELLFPMDVE